MAALAIEWSMSDYEEGFAYDMGCLQQKPRRPELCRISFSAVMRTSTPTAFSKQKTPLMRLSLPLPVASRIFCGHDVTLVAALPIQKVACSTQLRSAFPTCTTTLIHHALSRRRALRPRPGPHHVRRRQKHRCTASFRLEDMPAEGPYAVKPQQDRTDRTEHLMACEIRPRIRRPAAAHEIFAV